MADDTQQTEHPVDAVEEALDQSGLAHAETAPEDKALIDTPPAPESTETPQPDAPAPETAPAAPAAATPTPAPETAPDPTQPAPDPDQTGAAPAYARLSPEDLELPPEYQGKARQTQRWDTLRHGYQAQETRADEAEAMLARAHPIVERMLALDERMTAAGISNEQVEALMQVAHAVNEGTPQTLAWARAEAQALIEGIDARLGFVGPGGSDVVGRFTDLHQAVESGEITEAYAEQLALSRLRERGHQQHAAQVSQYHAVQQQRAAEHMEREAGREAVNRLDAHLERTIPNYNTIFKPALRAQLPDIVARTAPGDWAPLINAQVRAMQQAGAGADAGAPAPAPGRAAEFLRPGAGSPGAPGHRDPTAASNAFEAADIALTNAGLQPTAYNPTWSNF